MPSTYEAFNYEVRPKYLLTHRIIELRQRTQLHAFRHTGSTNSQIMADNHSNTQSDLTSVVLHALEKQDPLLSTDAFPGQKSADIKSALDRLASRSMITYETIDREEAVLEPEAQEIAANGSHEARVFEALRQAMDGLTIPELEQVVGDKNAVKVGYGKAFRSKWIAKGKEGRLVAAVRFHVSLLVTVADDRRLNR